MDFKHYRYIFQMEVKLLYFKQKRIWSYKCFKEYISRLPFSALSINSDNGSEFINWEVLRYSKSNNIQFTRTRLYKKDDDAYIERKNWSNVRKLIGWDRYEGLKSQKLLNKFYTDNLRIFFNLFMPSLKL